MRLAEKKRLLLGAMHQYDKLGHGHLLQRRLAARPGGCSPCLHRPKVSNEALFTISIVESRFVIVVIIVVIVIERRIPRVRLNRMAHDWRVRVCEYEPFEAQIIPLSVVG